MMKQCYLVIEICHININSIKLNTKTVNKKTNNNIYMEIVKETKTLTRFKNNISISLHKSHFFTFLNICKH